MNSDVEYCNFDQAINTVYNVVKVIITKPVKKRMYKYLDNKRTATSITSPFSLSFRGCHSVLLMNGLTR